uniref:SGNH hydrolase-type esterase domain-containing protein n=1 Tax=Bionectria ochroleuca TaxID=29856 RepID=A0A8H7MZM2_BIOOC
MHLVSVLSMAVALASFGSAACIRDDAAIQATEPKYLFIFGDSYTRTNFDIAGTKPSSKNPLEILDGPGLLSKYNNDTLTYNFAVGGATVDRAITGSKPKSTVTEQVKIWDNNLKNKPSYAKWTSSNAAVGVWIGINDIGSTYMKSNTEEILTKVVDKYFSLLEHLYNSGVRKFFLIKVPRNYEPYPTDEEQRQRATVKNVTEAVTFYNNYLDKKTTKWRGHHSDLKVKLVETHAAFNTALDNPTKYGSKDNKCTNSDGKTCLWKDGYHPGIQIQKLVGFQVKDALRDIGIW